MCDLKATGAPSIFKLIRKAAALARMVPTLALSCEEDIARRKWKSPMPKEGPLNVYVSF